MRLAGRFSRRVRAWGKASGVPILDCGRGERKHEIAEEYLAEHPVGLGVFMVLVARAGATVCVQRARSGRIRNLAKRTSFVNHYSFHIMDPEWGHMTIKNVRASAVRRAGDPQRARVCGLPSARAGDRFY
jgi:hypothetical protein